MPHTIDLLNKALETKKAAAWCRDLNITKGAISKAKDRGRLSPTLASVFAMEMGADPIFWAAVAAAEAEPAGPLRERLEASLNSQKTAHYGQAHDGQNTPETLADWSAICRGQTTRRAYTPTGARCHKPMQSRLAANHRRTAWRLRPLRGPSARACAPIERHAPERRVCQR